MKAARRVFPAAVVAIGLAGALALSAPPARADAGDFVHTPAPEQKVNTPLPVYVEYAGELGRVVVKYAGTGVKTWSRLEMKRVGQGWGGLIPCGAVTAGAMRYWIDGFDPSGDPVATSGDPKHPFVVPIRETVKAKPHLPGRAPPQTCSDQPAAGEAEEAEPAPPRPAAPKSHADEEPSSHASDEADADAEPRRRPRHVPAGEAPFARWWIGVSGALDFVSLSAGSDLCVLTAGASPANAAGDYCTNPDGTDFPPRTHAGATQNAALVRGSAGQLPGGVTAGDVRALVAVDYAVTSSILVGARLGYVLNAYPTGGAAVTDHRAFGAHVHAEARVAYVFGDDPLTRVGFAPTVFGAAGAAEFDGHQSSVVSYATTMGHPVVTQPVDVWRTDGPWFLAAGGGARYQFSARTAFTGLARVNAAFGGAGVLLTFGPEIGFQYGF
ncbi:MAG TPA: hypothetical protein VHV30_16870 [Polyangiaceae bacterium]|jgi:hypothetical protein|nr:hypothetical protein [Polyangiaceae bacterium]